MVKDDPCTQCLLQGNARVMPGSSANTNEHDTTTSGESNRQCARDDLLDDRLWRPARM